MERQRRRSWKWWLANAMIIAGVLVLAYPFGTWAYTWFVQRGLRADLEQADPHFAQVSGLLDAGGLTLVTIPSTTSTAPAGPVVTLPQVTSESVWLSQLRALETAAAAFAASVRGKPGTAIGRIVLPAIGLDVVMVEGVEGRDLREGPGHWPETPFPGQGGHFVVSGHRTTYGAPFLKLNKVVVGDELYLVLPYAVLKYRVTRVIVVSPRDMKDVASFGKEMVSLAACHPLYSARQRIVVQGEMTGFALAAGVLPYRR